MPRFFNPPAVPNPGGRYSQCVQVPAGARRLILSGQVGAKADGTVVEGIEAQTEQVFDNIVAVLKAGGMEMTDIVKMTVFCAAPDGAAAIREVRNRRMNGHAPASTFLHVAGLANPHYLVEIEAEAVREGES